jgi:hypothetical protein
VDTDIRKPDTGAAHFERPSNQPSTAANNSPHIRTPEVQYTEPLSEGEEDEEVALDLAPDEDKITGLDPTVATEARSFRENFLQQRAQEDEEKKKKQQQKKKMLNTDTDNLSDDDERTPFLRRRKSSVVRSERPKNLSIYPLAPSSQFDQNFKSKLYNGRSPKDDASDLEEVAEEEHEEQDLERQPGPSHQNVEFLREWRAQDGKRISVPVRIEPKVYFASERTFLVCSIIPLSVR